MWLEAICKPEDHQEKCLSCGGGVQRRVFGEMHAGSYVQDGNRLEIRRVPNEGFANPIYLDPLTQYFDGGLYRIWPSETYLSRGGKKLHRDVWTAAFGKIPSGCHIHHRDGNVLNNAIENLECLDSTEHLQKTMRERHDQGRGSKISDETRRKAAEWHRSEEGRLWHKRHAERSKSWTKWKRVEKNCLVCQKLFNALERKSGYTQIYCSNNCKATSYRRRKALGEG